MRPSPAPAGPAPLTAAPQAFSAQTHVGAQFEPRVPGTCFDLFGVDLMFDADGKPWLLEVNNGPGIFFLGPKSTALLYYNDRLLPGVLSTFGVDRENDNSTRAAVFARELRRCMVGLPFGGGRLRVCPHDDGADCIAPEDERALWLAFDERCTAEERGFLPAFPRAGARGWHIGTPPRIDRLSLLWQERCSRQVLCNS